MWRDFLGGILGTFFRGFWFILKGFWAYLEGFLAHLLKVSRPG